MQIQSINYPPSNRKQPNTSFQGVRFQNISLPKEAFINLQKTFSTKDILIKKCNFYSIKINDKVFLPKQEVIRDALTSLSEPKLEKIIKEMVSKLEKK